MKLQTIQALRGLAALLVVIYHTRSLEGLSITGLGASESPLVGGLFENGYAGVDLFFVISGFIMVWVTQGQPAHFRTSLEFLFARIGRIYPIWWAFAGIMTGYMVLAHGLNPNGGGWDVISRGAPLTPYLLNSFFLLPQPDFPVLGVGWTLIHEVYFYVVFTLILLLSRRFWPLVLLAWGVTVVAGSLAGLSGPFAGTIVMLLFYPMTMEFIFGAAAALMVTSGIQWRPGLLLLVAALWLLGAMCFQGIETDATLQWGRVVWFGLPSTLLIFSLATLETQGRLAWLVPAVAGLFAGGLVYGLYGLTSTSAESLRLGATIMALSIAATAMLAVLWAGWLAGNQVPRALHAMAPPLRQALGAAVRIGDWSFSLYLGHMIFMSLTRRAFEAGAGIDALRPLFEIGHAGRLDNVAFILAAIATALVGAWLTYSWIERPAIIAFSRAREFLFYRRERYAQVAAD